MELSEAIQKGKVSVLEQVVTPKKIYYRLELNIDSSDPDYESLKALVDAYNKEFSENVKE